MNKDEMKNWIDNASYEQLLSRWRLAPIGDLMFQGEIGDYYGEVMKKKRGEVGNEEHVRASKSIGWK
ncbi:MAG: hypothetical protein E3J87_03470 [Candidatus Cloacimonadota bacterium]|nr:MAG: hypothetical protein E3J87_03470 [Candidatus Cloacimonadota bacterium]